MRILTSLSSTLDSAKKNIIVIRQYKKNINNRKQKIKYMFLISQPKGFEIIIFLFALTLILLPVYCIVNLIRNPMEDPVKRLLYVLLIIFVPVLGSFFYLITRDYGTKQSHL